MQGKKRIEQCNIIQQCSGIKNVILYSSTVHKKCNIKQQYSGKKCNIIQQYSGIKNVILYSSTVE